MRNKIDLALRNATRLRTVVNMPEYTQTIGAWLNEAHTSALHELTTATEPHEFHKAQGAYNAIQSIQQQFESVWAAEKAALEKKAKQGIDNDHANE